MEITQKQKNKLQYVEDCMKNALTEEQEYKIYMKEKEKAQANISKIRDRFKKENTEPKTWFNCIRQWVHINNIDDELVDREMEFAKNLKKSS